MKKIAFVSFIVSILVVLLVSTPSLFAEEKLTITGVVNNNYQIVTDEGQTYNIGDNDKGMELDNYAGARVEVFGTLSTVDDELVIMVSDYKIISTES